MQRQAQSQLAADDLVVGSVVAERTLTLDAACFGAFSAMTGDKHPIHDDIAYVQAKGLRAPIAHGLLLVAISALGATALSPRLHDSMVAMLGVEADFVAPVFEGDTVQLRFVVGEVVAGSRGRSRVRFDIDISTSTVGNAGLGAPTLAARVRHRFLLKTSLAP